MEDQEEKPGPAVDGTDGSDAVPLPDTPASRQARRVLFRVLLALFLVNLGVLAWVLLTGWLSRSGPAGP